MDASPPIAALAGAGEARGDVDHAAAAIITMALRRIAVAATGRNPEIGVCMRYAEEALRMAAARR